MQREYACPHCGWTVDSARQMTHCPRCSERLPSHMTQELIAPTSERALRGVKHVPMEYGEAWRPEEFDDTIEAAWYQRPEGIIGMGICLALLFSFLGVWAFLDTDRDGLAAWQEWRHGINPLTDDTDQDSLPDEWELTRNLDPDGNDTDRDGVSDGFEVVAQSNPLAGDSDSDGLMDSTELFDCDRDGRLGLVETDDDHDGLPDNRETESRCDPDFDGDTIPDGQEGNLACIADIDCDNDGLPDPDEGPAGLDPLNPDSKGYHVGDLATWATVKRGTPAGGDADSDWIPDPVEDGGTLGWGPFDPDSSRPDLLVSFVRLVGPDSERASAVNLKPAMDILERSYGAAGIHFSWAETTYSVSEEPNPRGDPDPWVVEAISAAPASGNPYVNVVVLLPGTTTQPAYSAGRALGSYADLGESLVFLFGEQGQLRLRPSMEVGNVDAYGNSTATVDGVVYHWRAPYFRSNPAPADGPVLVSQGVDLDAGGLATAIQTALKCSRECDLCPPHAPLLAFGRGQSETAIAISKLNAVPPGDCLERQTALGRDVEPRPGTVWHPPRDLLNPPRPVDRGVGLAVYAAVAMALSIAGGVIGGIVWARRDKRRHDEGEHRHPALVSARK